MGGNTLTRSYRVLGRSLLRGGIALAVLGSSGCTIGGVDLVADSVRESFNDGVSPAVKVRMESLHSLPYAQLYGRFDDNTESVFLLAEQESQRQRDLWIGGNAITLVTIGPNIQSSNGLPTDLLNSETVRSGHVEKFLAGTRDDIQPGSREVRWLLTSTEREWIEQIATVEKLQEVYYQGLAYTGPALRISERVQITGRRGSFTRNIWIETRTRTLLRLQTQLLPKSGEVVLEWVRPPDRSDRR